MLMESRQVILGPMNIANMISHVRSYQSKKYWNVVPPSKAAMAQYKMYGASPADFDCDCGLQWWYLSGRKTDPAQNQDKMWLILLKIVSDLRNILDRFSCRTVSNVNINIPKEHYQFYIHEWLSYAENISCYHKSNIDITSNTGKNTTTHQKTNYRDTTNQPT